MTLEADSDVQDPRVRDERYNRAGRARAMTVLSPVQKWARFPLNLRGRVVRLPVPGWPATEVVFGWVRANLTESTDIEKLSFIHFARWGLIRSIPDLGQPTERLEHPMFMFESNYDGTFEQYIDAFSSVLGSGMTAFWFTSCGFPGPRPVQPFKDYIRQNEFVLDHYYSAYPTESVTQVAMALELRDRHIEFRNTAADCKPAEFASRFEALLALPKPPNSAPDGGRLWRRLRRRLRQASRFARELFRTAEGPGRRSRNGRSLYFTSLAPIRDDAEAELADLLERLEGSPFAAIPSVHMARWLIIDGFKYGWKGAPENRTQLASSYLLCTAVVTADDDFSAELLPDSFLYALLEGTNGVATSVWSHCLGFPDKADIDASVAYLKRSQLDTLLFYGGYPSSTPADVRRAATGRDLLSSFVRCNEERGPAGLQAAYLKEASAWDL